MWMKGPYTEMYEDEMRRLARRINKNRNATVVHHETCPRCGAKLVNLYRRESVWMCRRCWEKHDAEGIPIVTLGAGKLYMVDKDGNHTLLGEVKEETPALVAARRILEREENNLPHYLKQMSPAEKRVYLLGKWNVGEKKEDDHG